MKAYIKKHIGRKTTARTKAAFCVLRQANRIKKHIGNKRQVRLIVLAIQKPQNPQKEFLVRNSQVTCELGKIKVFVSATLEDFSLLVSHKKTNISSHHGFLSFFPLSLLFASYLLGNK